MPASWYIADFENRVVLRVRGEIEVGIGEKDDEGDCEGKAGYLEARGHCKARAEGYIQERREMDDEKCNGPINPKLRNM